MSILYFVRHGQAAFKSENYDQLSPLGERQAAIAGDFFKRSGATFDAVFTGTLQRQTETARIILERMGSPMQPRVIPQLDEHATKAIIQAYAARMVGENPSLMDDLSNLFKSVSSFVRVYKRAMLMWMSGEQADDEIESWAAFTGRVREGIRIIGQSVESGAKVLAVASGGPIAATTRAALDLDARRTVLASLAIRNASVSVFNIDGDDATLLTFNSVAHLEAENDKTLLTFV